MADGPMNSLQSRTLRWMLIICLTGLLAGVIVPLLAGLLLPDSVYREIPEAVFFWAVVAVTVGLSVGIHLLTRRKAPRPPR